MNVLVVVGTRPEAIKMAPLVRLLRKDRRFKSRLCSTGQQKDLLPGALRALDLKPDMALSLSSLSFEKISADLVLVQGDTTSALAAAQAARRRGIAVGHVEAGLRSFDFKRPFPEEKNRFSIDRISRLLFAPTPAARTNLLREGLPASRIFVTGNTGIDSLLWALRRPARKAAAAALARKNNFAVVTLHRREAFGRPLEKIMSNIVSAAEQIPDLNWVFPVHPNPNVSQKARRLLSHPRITLTRPLDYPNFVRLLRQARFIVTDSGGIQEEAPTLGKTVLVVRDKTERPELMGCGGGRLIGVSSENLVGEAKRLAEEKTGRLRGENPFGDGKASRRVLDAILYWGGKRKDRPADWDGSSAS